jgi:hypothetical protein
LGGRKEGNRKRRRRVAHLDTVKGKECVKRKEVKGREEEG